MIEGSSSEYDGDLVGPLGLVSEGLVVLEHGWKMSVTFYVVYKCRLRDYKITP